MWQDDDGLDYDDEYVGWNNNVRLPACFVCGVDVPDDEDTCDDCRADTESDDEDEYEEDDADELLERDRERQEDRRHGRI